MSFSTQPLTFIVGMSRGGTTWMSTSLSRHHDIAVYGESMYWGRSFVPPNQDGYYTNEHIQKIKDRLSHKGILGNDVGELININEKNIRQLLDLAVSKLPEHATPGDFFMEITNAISAFENKSLVIEKTPHHINYIGLIRNYLPDARFIIMHRFPYDFMLSFKHQANRKKLNSFEKLSARLVYHPIGCALVWRKFYKSIKNAKEELPASSYCEIIFEDLKNSPDETLKIVQKFLGVDIVPNLSSKMKNTSFPTGKRPQLKSDDIFWMNLICHKELSDTGVKKLNCPNISDIFISFIKIPLWLPAAFLYLSRNVNGNVFSYIKKIIF
ncbi:sulfotransferase [Thermodesulfobacteriota bacterium]